MANDTASFIVARLRSLAGVWLRLRSLVGVWLRSLRSLGSTLRQAIRGTPQDLTAIPIRRAVVFIAVPTVLEMVMESILTLVDIFVVSKLGSVAVAVVGLTEGMLSPIYALAMGLAAGATAMIARRVGEKDRSGAALAAVQVCLLAFALAALLGTAGAFGSRRLLGLMGADSTVVASGTTYAALMLGGSVTLFLLFVVNAIFRSVGDAAVAMRALWLANLLNIALAPLLVFGVGPFPRLGVLGAAVATTASRAVGVAYQASIFVRGRGQLTILRRHLTLRIRLVAEIAALAAPAAGQVLIETASWLGLMRILSTYGSVVLAGYTIAMRIVVFTLLPSWGLAQAAAALVGQNLGAGAPDRARRSVWTVARYNVAFLAPVALVFALRPAWFVAFFTNDAEVLAYAQDCLRIVAVGFCVFAFGMVAIQAFNGAGDTATPLVINLASFWLFKIPCALLLAKVAGMGPRGVFLAITAAYAAQSLVAGALFRRGRWQTRRV
jgi:putative MATE family efflux protein